MALIAATLLVERTIHHPKTLDCNAPSYFKNFCCVPAKSLAFETELLRLARLPTCNLIRSRKECWALKPKLEFLDDEDFECCHGRAWIRR